MIYLDHNASSTPTVEHLKDLFDILSTQRPANPSSQHTLGRAAAVFLSQARKNLAKSLCSDPSEVIFTSGGTEANNLATRGVFEKKIQALDSKEKVSILTTAIEHPCVLKTFQFIHHACSDRVELITIPVNKCGYIDARDVLSKIKPNTILISIMSANNEIGTVQPTKEIGDFLDYVRWQMIPEEFKNCVDSFKEEQKKLMAYISSDVSLQNLQNLHFHVDAVQSFGKIETHKWMSRGYDSVAISGHKIGALQGIGALILRKGRSFVPLQIGGSQEKNRRSGTENLPGIISLGIACEKFLKKDHWDKVENMKHITHQLYDSLLNSPQIVLNSQKQNALPNTIHFSIQKENVLAEDIILHLDMHSICVGSGAACSSGVHLPSHVLLAMKKSDHLAKNTIRVSLGLENTKEEIKNFLKVFFKIIEK